MPSARSSMLERAPQERLGAEAEKPRPVAFRGAGFVPSAGRYGGWIALAIVLALWQLGQSAVPAAALGDCGRALEARDLGRAVAARLLVDHADRLGLDHWHRGRRRGRLCDRALDAGAQC